MPLQTEAIRDLRDKAGYLLRRAFQRSLALFTEEARDFDVTSPQYIILVALAVIAKEVIPGDAADGWLSLEC